MVLTGPQRRRQPPQQVAKEMRGKCRHLGKQVSSIGCVACGKDVLLPIYECRGGHEECVFGASREGIHGCSGCADWKPIAAVSAVFEEQQ